MRKAADYTWADRNITKELKITPVLNAYKLQDIIVRTHRWNGKG